MATKLKNLKIRKVDFVDEGANPDAHIRMLKRKGARMQQGEEYAMGSTRNVLARLLSFIGKAANMRQEEIDTAVEEIQKNSVASFQEKLNEAKMRKIADEIWDTCFALQSSFCSALNDEGLDSAGAAVAMQASLDEFYTAVQGFIAQWSGGYVAGIVKKKEELSGKDVEVMKSAVERLNASIQKVSREPGKEEEAEKDGEPKKEPDNEESQKGEEMKIDKSKLTDAEKAFMESIEKRYGTEGGTEAENGGTELGSVAALIAQETTTAGAGVAKFATPNTVPAVGTPMQQTTEADDIYKGLHPVVRAELEGLKKFREDAEAKELTEVAKKYAIIGKKEEELVPLFKNLKAAGGTAYNDMIAVLDQAVDAVEKSGTFSEIGKSGYGGFDGSSAEAKIEGIAKGYMEKDPALSYHAAVAKAWEDNPGIINEYDEEAGF